MQTAQSQASANEVRATEALRTAVDKCERYKTDRDTVMLLVDDITGKLNEAKVSMMIA